MKILVGWILLLLVVVGFAPSYGLDFETFVGPCPRPATVKNFDPKKYESVWYDVKRYKNTILKGTCGYADFLWNIDSKEYDLSYTNVEGPEVKLTLKPKDLEHGTFRVYRNGERTILTLVILDTDYENYSVLWSCNEIVPLLLNTQSLNIFARQPKLDAAHLALALNGITARKLDTTRLDDVTQENGACGRS